MRYISSIDTYIIYTDGRRGVVAMIFTLYLDVSKVVVAP